MGSREKGSPGAGTATAMGRLVLASCSGGIYGCKYIYSVCVSGVSSWSNIHPSGCGRDGALGWAVGCSELPPLCTTAFPWVLPDALVRSDNDGSLLARLPAVPACMAPTHPFSYLLQAERAEPFLARGTGILLLVQPELPWLQSGQLCTDRIPGPFWDQPRSSLP